MMMMMMVMVMVVCITDCYMTAGTLRVLIQFMDALRQHRHVRVPHLHRRRPLEVIEVTSHHHIRGGVHS
jgi:hypothetical protein